MLPSLFGVVTVRLRLVGRRSQAVTREGQIFLQPEYLAQWFADMIQVVTTLLWYIVYLRE